jgi:hypothetical protein
LSRPRDRGWSLVANPADCAATVHKSPFNQPLDEPALAAQAPFQASHPAIIVLVIIAKKMQQAMQSQDPELDRARVPRLPGLAAGKSFSNHDIAKIARLASGKREHVRYPVLAAVTAIQRADAGIGDNGHRHLAPGSGGCNGLQPVVQPRRTNSARRNHMDDKGGRS